MCPGLLISFTKKVQLIHGLDLYQVILIHKSLLSRKEVSRGNHRTLETRKLERGIKEMEMSEKRRKTIPGRNRRFLTSDHNKVR